MNERVIMSMIQLPCVDKLVDVGLNRYEALAYLALLEENKATAIDVAHRSGVPKQRIYDVLDNLQAKGLCSIEEGRPRCYTAFQPHQALPALLAYRKQQQTAENERQSHLIAELIPVLAVAFNGKNGEESAPVPENNNGDLYRDIGGF